MDFYKDDEEDSLSLRFRKISEPVRVQEFIADFIVQALGVAVLLRLPALGSKAL